MLVPPDNGPERPWIVRFALGNVRSRTTARRLVWLSAAFIVVALLFQDPILVGLAVIAVAAYSGSIYWMDRHDAWDALPADAAPYAVPGVTVSEPRAEREPRESGHSTEGDRTVGDRAPATTVATSPSRAVAVLTAAATVAFLVALAALESSGPAPVGAHLLAVIEDALFGLGFGVAAVIVAMRRPRIPFERAVTFMASTGMGLVAGLGFLVASNGLSLNQPVGLGASGALFILVTASAAGGWLTGTSGGRLGWALAIPAVLLGWYLGLAAWVAHIHAA